MAGSCFGLSLSAWLVARCSLLALLALGAGTRGRERNVRDWMVMGAGVEISTARRGKWQLTNAGRRTFIRVVG